MELSAFWRRRLDRLKTLGVKRRPMSWFGAITFCAAAGMMVVAPRVRFDVTARAQEAVAGSRDGAAGAAKLQAAGPFTATFSNGAKVEVIGISEHPSGGNTWWAADGTRLDTAPYARVPTFSHGSKDLISREICFRWSNLPEDPDFQKSWAFLPDSSQIGGGTPFDAQDEQMEYLTAWYVWLKPRDTCALRFSVSARATPWTTVYTSDGSPSSMHGTIDGIRQGAIFGEPYSDRRGTSITVSYEIPDRAVRLIAMGTDGLPDVATTKGSGGALGFAQVTYHFATLKPEQIRRFELQTQRREFESIEFRNASLHAAKRTKVEIIGDTQLRHERSAAALEALANKRGYRLTENEPLKHMPLPFPEERSDVAGLLGSYFSQGPRVASPPVEVIRYQWKDDQLLAQSFDHVKPTLQMVLDTVFGLKLQDLDGDLDLLKGEVPGDWVLSWDSREDHTTNAAEIAVLERALREQLDQAIKLELRDVERPVYVVRGRYKFTPVAGPDGKIQRIEGDVAAKADGMFQIPGRRTNISYSVGSYDEFLHAMGQLVLTPLVDEAEARPDKESFFWHYHGAVPPALLERFDDKTTSAILASITQQTGLTFHPENRRVTTLHIQGSDSQGE
jgi:hypothetical protein